MSNVFTSISVSLDGYVAGPDTGPGNPLGDHGEQLHTWLYGLASWRTQHGLDGGEGGPDADVLAEDWARTGAYVMGRRMYECGAGSWGDEPPFHAPVFVVTGTPREPVVKDGGTTFTFVTDVEAAVARARRAAGIRDVAAPGGGRLVRELLAAGLLDEIQLHLVPVLLGAGVRLFDGTLDGPVEFETTRVIASPDVTHLRMTVAK